MADQATTHKAEAAEVAQLEGEMGRLIGAVDRALRQGVAQPEALEVIGRLINLLADAGPLSPIEGARLKRDFWRGEFERVKRAIGHRDPSIAAELVAEFVAEAATPARCAWKDCGAKADTVIAGREYCAQHVTQARTSVAR